MNIVVSKENRLNIRVKPDFKDDLRKIATYHGLTVSSYVHSVLVKTIRQEKENLPADAFEDQDKTKTPASRVSATKPDENEDDDFTFENKPGEPPRVRIKNPEGFKKFRKHLGQPEPKDKE